MEQKKFLRDRRYSDKRNKLKSIARTVAKIGAAVLLSALILSLVGYTLDHIQRKKYRDTYAEYHAKCDAGEYESALRMYRNLYERSNHKTWLGLYDELARQTVLRIESDIEKRIGDPFTELLLRDRPFDDRDIVMMESFQEVSVRIITSQIDSILSCLINGSVTSAKAKAVFNQIKEIDLYLSPLFAYEEQIQGIADFAPEMNRIETLKQQESYLEAAEHLASLMDHQTGFIRKYLNDYLSDLKQSMYQQESDRLDELIRRDKFYTGQRILERVSVFFPDDPELEKMNDIFLQKTAENLIEFMGPVEHLSVRPLIADRSFRFDADAYTRNAEDLMLLTDEFEKILHLLYRNQYILIDIESLINEKGKRNPIFVPEGKKPLILSIEGLNYYASRFRTGNSRQLLLDSSGFVVSAYLDENGNSVIDRNGEAVGILEQFIERYPDFSFDGAKGTISLTGFECIFGFLTDPDQIDDRALAYREHLSLDFHLSQHDISEQKNKATEVIRALRQKGWTFSSSTYGNINVGETSAEMLQADTKKWIDQVGKLTGPVKTILFPYGSVVKSTDAKGAYLIQNDFRIHCGIGPTAYFNWGNEHLFMDRVLINGYALRNTDLSRFFDVKKVYSNRRTRPLK